MVKAYVREVGFGPQDDVFGAHYTPVHINRYMYMKTVINNLKSTKKCKISCQSRRQSLVIKQIYMSSLPVAFSAPCVFGKGATKQFLQSFNDSQIPDFIEAVKCHILVHMYNLLVYL